MNVHTDFSSAFGGDQVFESSHGDLPVRQKVAGRLIAPSGRIVACDPRCPDRAPFTHKVPAGRHPVIISVVDFGRYERIACAMLKFGPTTPIIWELAMRDCRQREDHYGVDTGTGCFADMNLLESVSDDELELRLTTAYEGNESKLAKCGGCGDIGFADLKHPNLIAFHSGWGDGRYKSYWGFDRKRRRVCLVTDFDVLIENVKASVTFDNVAASRGKLLDHEAFNDLDSAVRVGRENDGNRTLVVRTKGALCRSAEMLIVQGELKTRPYYISHHVRTANLARNESKFLFKTRRKIRDETKLELSFISSVIPLRPKK